ncbi:MAG: hypothetical protein NVS1B6_14550 [Steroidobacteraceae bacterium]
MRNRFTAVMTVAALILTVPRPAYALNNSDFCLLVNVCGHSWKWGLVRKEDSRLRGNVLSMFIKLSRCFGSRFDAIRKGGITYMRNPQITQANLKDHLRNWMRGDPTVVKYLPRRDAVAIGKLTPERLRLSNYEEISRILIDEFGPGLWPYNRQ